MNVVAMDQARGRGVAETRRNAVTRVPTWALHRVLGGRRSRYMTVVVVTAMCSIADQFGRVQKTLGELEEASGMERASIRRAIKRMQDEGILTVRRARVPGGEHLHAARRGAAGVSQRDGMSWLAGWLAGWRCEVM